MVYIHLKQIHNMKSLIHNYTYNLTINFIKYFTHKKAAALQIILCTGTITIISTVIKQYHN